MGQKSLSAAPRPFSWIGLAELVTLAAIPLLAAATHSPYYIDLFTRIMIFALAAASLDIALGFGGMASFNQAAYVGAGAYAVGILSFYGYDNALLHLVVAIGAAAALALIVGFVSLRATGVHFIMITLAFGQMAYYLAISVNAYGGDDGLNIAGPSQIFGWLDLRDGVTLYYVVFTALALFLFLGARITRSRFGMVLAGIRINDRRMTALGFPVGRYKLTALLISASASGLAGALLANQTLFVSPAIMTWARSGEILMMVIVGGAGTLFGPVLGAAIMLVLEDTLSGWTEHWQLIFGPILVGVVILTRQGVFGAIERLFRARHHD